MSTHDVKGRPYARLSQLRPGDFVVVDDGFTCMKRWSVREVMEDPDRIVEVDSLWIPCFSGKPQRHYLSGQLDEETDAIVGVYWKEDFTR